MSHVEDTSMPHVDSDGNDEDQDDFPKQSNTMAPSVEVRQRWRIAQLEEKLLTLESTRTVKERYDGKQMNHRLFSQSDRQASQLLHGSRKGHQARCRSIR